jgi:hypothetical protein
MFIYDCSFVYFILHVLSVVVSLIGGVPRMGPRNPFALLPFGHYPIKYSKQNKTKQNQNKISYPKPKHKILCIRIQMIIP